MSDAREVILARIERALRTGRIPVVPGLGDPARVARDPSISNVGDAQRVGHTPPPPDVGRPLQGRLEERFLTEARALGVETFIEASPALVCQRLAEVIGDRRVLSWNPEQLPYGAGSVVAGALAGSAPVREQAQAGIGVTGCDAAIAETGSLVLLSGAGTSRTVSLLPPIHVALVRPQQIVATMAAYFAANAAGMAGASSCTIVTGPSRTADIELSLTIGVHGPGRLVFIVGP
jgi:L-lactate dehydrogenase complex protein LldG